mmetsp:Transcript_60105/g.175622  ORF Transcript_60105/g.175622 Transcript_60105/m.175622 type:complete len:223 (+) Transcript_60105:464-1132(+)
MHPARGGRGSGRVPGGLSFLPGAVPARRAGGHGGGGAAQRARRRARGPLRLETGRRGEHSAAHPRGAPRREGHRLRAMAGAREAGEPGVGRHGHTTCAALRDLGTEGPAHHRVSGGARALCAPAVSGELGFWREPYACEPRTAGAPHGRGVCREGGGLRDAGLGACATMRPAGQEGAPLALCHFRHCGAGDFGGAQARTFFRSYGHRKSWLVRHRRVGASAV